MRYELPWYEDRAVFPDDPTMWRGYTAQDYTLAYALGVADNYAAEALVRAHLTAVDTELLTRVTFDSEHGCFFAYMPTHDDARRLAAHVAALVAARNPAAIPGTILDSPACIRDFEELLEPADGESPG